MTGAGDHHMAAGISFQAGLPATDRERASALTALVLVPMAFLAPFGELQNTLLFGLTVQKVFMPLVVLILAVFASRSFRFHPVSVLLLGFVLLTTTSLMTGVDFEPVLLSMVGAFLIVTLICNGVCTFRDVESILRAYLVGMAVVTVVVALAVANVVDVGAMLGHPMVTRGWFGVPFVQGTESNTTSFGLFYLVGIPLAVGELLRAKTWPIRISLLVFLFAMLAEALLVYARGSLIGAVVGSIVVMHYGARRRQKIIIAIIGLSLIAAVVITAAIISELDTSGNDLILRGLKAMLATKGESNGQHSAVLFGGIEVASTAPPWGVGFGNLPRQMYYLTGFYLSAHNAYLTIAAQFGLFAVVLFVAFYVCCIYEARRVACSETDRSKRTVYSVVLGIGCAFFVASLFHDDYINSTIWIFWGLVLASGNIKPLTLTSPGERC